ncbi:MAG: right-handed parallel beta-helix repeat-containing protein [Bacteroidales bacterium]|nr:right-handed parallel beta-helix repeat-containing protein [Bacteroidales bacterium]
MNFKKIYFITLFVIIFIFPGISQEWIPINGNNTPEKPEVTVISSDEHETIIHVSIKGFYKEDIVVDGITYQKLKFPGYFTTQTIGKPALPVITEMIGIPNDKNVNIFVINSKKIEILNYYVYPFQTPLLENEEPLRFDIDEKFYLSGSYFPEISTKVTSPMIWRNIRNVNIAIMPVRNNPATGSLQILSEFIIKIEYSGKSNINVLSSEPKYISTEYEKMYKSLVLNYDYLSLNKKISKAYSDYEYLIITVDNYADKFDDFIKHKHHKGLKTKLVTISETGNTCNNIKQYISNEYYEHEIEYVLLVGDYYDIPQYDWTYDSDYWYGCMDSKDYHAEISIGRFSVNNNEELNNIINKSIKYENNPPLDNWVKKSLLIAHKQLAPNKYQACKERIRTAVNTNSGTYSIMYPDPDFDKAYGAHPAQGGNDATNQTIIDAINEGRGVVNYRGHGNPNGWLSCWSYEGNAFDYDETTSLTNGDYTPIIFSIACRTGYIEGDCHAETFTNMEQGAVAYFGATVNTPTSVNHTLDEQLYNQAFDLGFLNISLTATKAKIATLIEHDYYPTAILDAKAYFWCGDPSLEIWTDIPKNMYTQINYNENWVRVVNENYIPIQGAKVSFKNGSAYYFRETNSQGYAYPRYNLVEANQVGASYPGYLPMYTQRITSNQTWTEANPIRGNVFVLSGKTLTINGNLKLPKYAKLIIEGTGKVVINSGKTLYLDGDIELRNTSSVLEINGAIRLNNNNNCTISGSGYVKLNNANAIQAETGTSLTFDGTSRSYKLLVINQKTYIPSNINVLKIKDGKIVMNNTYAELYINSGVDNVTLDNIRVTSSSGSYNAHDGIDIRSSGNITVKNSIFEYGYYGIYTSRAASAPLLNVNNTTFKYCRYGLRVYNSGININNCTFMYNTYSGLYCRSMDKQSYINNNIVRYQNGTRDYGIYYEGSSSASVNLYGNNISNNYYGIIVSGPFNAVFKCNTIANNSDKGIYGYNQVDLYLANAPGISAGTNDLHGNKICIYGNGYPSSNLHNRFYLNNGYNDLRGGSYCMYGYFKGLTGGTTYANNNYWKSGGGSPVNYVDYRLYGGVTNIILSDNSPENSFTHCTAPGPGKPMSMDISYAPYDEIYDYREVNTSMGEMPLNVAINTALNNSKESGRVYDIKDRLDLLSEILHSNLRNLNYAEQWYVKHAYNKMKSDIGKVENDENDNLAVKNSINKMLKVIRKLTKEQANNNENSISPETFMFIVDEANMLWYGGNYDEAIELLKKTEPKLKDEDVCYFEELICKINLDREIVVSNFTGNIDKELENCEKCGGGLKSGSTTDGYIYEYENNQYSDEIINEISLSIIPNPVSQSSVISVLIPEDYNYSEVSIINITGTSVYSEQISSGNYEKTIINSELSEGIYLVVVRINGKVVATEKMLIVK